MPVDDGAQRIYELLNQPSNALRKNLLALTKAQRQAINKPYGVMPQYGINALAQIRAFYRELRDQISTIDTVDVVSRANALDALDAMDRSLDAFESSLEFGMSKPALAPAKKARNRSRVANSTMKATLRGLA